MGMSEGLELHQRRLPHWRLTGATYLVTWSLAPQVVSLNEAERNIVSSALRFFHLHRYHLWGYVVMDDHVHSVLTPFSKYPLSKTIHSWKSYTANKVNQNRGRTGRLWQVEYHDRIIRDGNDFREKMQYVLTNPERRWPGTKEYNWVGWTKDEFSYQ